MARIDTPRSFERAVPGRVVVGGAWAQTRGIEAVEISIDGGPFRPAELGAAVATTPGASGATSGTPPRPPHARRPGTDGTGEVQTEERSETLPDGASGWMSLVVTVDPDPSPT